MGVYYLAANDEKREWIDPGKIGEGGIKAYACVIGPLPRLVTYMLLTKTWAVARIVDDTGDEHGQIERTWKDVTTDAVKSFNHAFPDEQIQLYTGK